MDEMEKEMKLCFIEEGKQLLEEAEQCFLDLEGPRVYSDSRKTFPHRP